MMQNDINSTIEGLLNLKNQGKNPQVIMQNLIKRNPQYQTLINQMQNMAQGRSPQEFIMQLAKQNGVNEQNLHALSQMFGGS